MYYSGTGTFKTFQDMLVVRTSVVFVASNMLLLFSSNNLSIKKHVCKLGREVQIRKKNFILAENLAVI